LAPIEFLFLFLIPAATLLQLPWMTNSKSALPHSPSEFRLKSQKTLRQKLSLAMTFGNKMLAE
jgi:hypothetical protein